MRGAIDGLETPYPISTLLPAVFQEDAFTTRWTSGLDEVLAPVISTLDCLNAYLDPMLAPEDFVHWLAGCLGTVLDENWPLPRRRAVVARCVDLYRIRGTVAGLRGLLELATGAQVEVSDNGGATWSTGPSGRLPGRDQPAVTVRVTAGDRSAVDVTALDELIKAMKPAHVPHRIEVIER